MSGYHDLPDPPGEWRVSINKENHVCYHKTVEGEKIILTPDQSQLASGWTVSLIASDRWEQAPRFAEDVGLKEATEKVKTVIEALESGSEIEPTGYIPNHSTTDDTEDATVDDGSDDPADDSDTGGQADLSAFQ